MVSMGEGHENFKLLAALCGWKNNPYGDKAATKWLRDVEMIPFEGSEVRGCGEFCAKVSGNGASKKDEGNI